MSREWWNRRDRDRPWELWRKLMEPALGTGLFVQTDWLLHDRYETKNELVVACRQMRRTDGRCGLYEMRWRKADGTVERLADDDDERLGNA